jgi:hypothetical protein
VLLIAFAFGALLEGADGGGIHGPGRQGRRSVPRGVEARHRLDGAGRLIVMMCAYVFPGAIPNGYHYWK